VALFKEDKLREAALAKKRDEEKLKAKKAEEEKKAKDSNTTCEEVTDEEAEKIMKEEAERKARLEKGEDHETAVANKEEKKEGEEGETKSNKQQPNPGNGGTTDKYEWIQTLDDLTCFIRLPDGITSKELQVAMTNTRLKAGIKGQTPIIDAEFHKKIKCDDSMWSLESDGIRRILQLTIQKFEGQYWWHSVFVGDTEIDTQKVEPENSKLSDLDLETRSAVEKMMFDQN